ncbi:hypothetical protein PWT90_02941 [Aphanocladium album]|nr:hypothetical protein PWT90_02941 [Aphanocladium album]
MVPKGKEAVDKSQHCHTCRRQRLRCDGVRPTCNKCVARGVDCLGYGTQALLWVQPQSHDGGALAVRKRESPPQETMFATTTTPTHPAEAARRKKKGRPKLVLMQRTASELAMPNGEGLELTREPKSTHLTAFRREMKLRGFRDEFLQRRKIVLCPGLDPEGYQLQRLLIDSLRYYGDHVCSDLVLFDTPTNPFRVPIEFWSYVPDIVTDPLVSASAVHRISKTQSNLEVAAYVPGYKVRFRRNRLLSIKHPLVAVVFRHQQRMAGALAAMVADPYLCRHRGLLEAITTMILCEVQQSLFGDWDKHLRGAQAIISSRGGVQTLTAEKLSPVNYDICTIMQVTVMRDIGSPSCLLSTKKATLEDFLEHVIPVYQEGWLSAFPCTNFLMSRLICINMARCDDYHDNGGILTKISQRSRLLQEIVAFSPAAWLEARTPDLETMFAARAKDIHNDGTRSALLDLIQSMQMSVMLYAIRTLFLDNGIYALVGEAVEEEDEDEAEATPDGLLPENNNGVIDLRQAEAAAFEVLGASLRRIWAAERNSPDWFGKFTIWPLFVLGMSVDPATEPDETKDFVCRSLLRLGYHMGSMAYKDAIWAIQHTWEREEKTGRSTWLGELPVDIMPGLFFM